jgi:hypothetical protein
MNRREALLGAAAIMTGAAVVSDPATAQPAPRSLSKPITSSKAGGLIGNRQRRF